MVLEHVELGCHHGKEVTGLGEGIIEPHPVALARLVALAGKVAVGQQHRVLDAIGVDGVGIARHHVGAVEKISDAAKALGLALRKESAFGGVQTLELGVLLRVDAHHGLEGKTVVQAGDGEVLGVHRVFGGSQHTLVNGHRHQFKFVAIEHQRRALVLRFGIARHRQLGLDQGVVVADVHIKVDGGDDKRRRRVVLEVNRLGCGFAHGGLGARVVQRCRFNRLFRFRRNSPV